MIKKEIKDKIVEFVEKKVQKEKDKWNSGLKNDYYAWDDALNEVKDKLNAYIDLKE